MEKESTDYIEFFHEHCGDYDGPESIEEENYKVKNSNIFDLNMYLWNMGQNIDLWFCNPLVLDYLGNCKFDYKSKMYYMYYPNFMLECTYEEAKKELLFYGIKDEITGGFITDSDAALNTIRHLSN